MAKCAMRETGASVSRDPELDDGNSTYRSAVALFTVEANGYEAEFPGIICRELPNQTVL